MEKPQLLGEVGIFFLPPPGSSSKRRCSLGSPSQTGATQSEEHERRCPPCPLAGEKSLGVWVGAGGGLRPGDPVCQGFPSPLSNPSQTSRGGGGGGSGCCPRPAPRPARAPLRARRPPRLRPRSR